MRVNRCEQNERGRQPEIARQRKREKMVKSSHTCTHTPFNPIMMNRNESIFPLLVPADDMRCACTTHYIFFAFILFVGHRLRGAFSELIDCLIDYVSVSCSSFCAYVCAASTQNVSVDCIKIKLMIKYRAPRVTTICCACVQCPLVSHHIIHFAIGNISIQSVLCVRTHSLLSPIFRQWWLQPLFCCHFFCWRSTKRTAIPKEIESSGYCGNLFKKKSAHVAWPRSFTLRGKKAMRRMKNKQLS